MHLSETLDYRRPEDGEPVRDPCLAPGSPGQGVRGIVCAYGSGVGKVPSSTKSLG
jgi:hypothetical protein